MGGRWVRPSHPVGGIADRRPLNRSHRVSQTNQTNLIQQCSRSRGSRGPRRRGNARGLATSCWGGTPVLLKMEDDCSPRNFNTGE
ncbi:hypothetical protein E2C01_060438 [Portunus trituberculatus]|uniref:Uncharacterized protein n=1 Tax=Portunus trituberculatus TaxID=210409 RepID=A0A5B7H156_PORTR|nr:hypothetical protein [Portunus trituberculatus]